MKKLVQSILLISITLSTYALGLDGKWDIVGVNQSKGRVEVGGILTFKDHNRSMITLDEKESEKAECVEVKILDKHNVKPILKADLVLECIILGEVGEVVTLAIEKINETKLMGLILEDLESPLFFIKK